MMRNNKMAIQACDQCSSIKQKCDGQDPCCRCIRLDLSCQRLRGRGKQSRDKINQAKTERQELRKKYKAVVVRRDKTGCDSCKKRKKKCDELKPKCSDCRRLNLPCGRQGDQSADSPPEPTLVDEVLQESSLMRRTSSSLSSEMSICPPTDMTPPLTIASELDEHEYPSDPKDMSPAACQNLFKWLTNADFKMLQLMDFTNEAVELNLDPDVEKTAQDLSILATRRSLSEDPEYLMDEDGKMNLVPVRSAGSLTYSIDIPPLGLTNPQDRHLFQHYAQVVSKTLCLASSDEENPFLEWIMPLASKNNAVMGALLALSATHLKHNEGYQDSVHRGMNHQIKALAGLNDLIASTPTTTSSSFKETALAAILLLCIIDIREGASSRWSCHIAAAKTLILSQKAAPSTNPTYDTSPTWSFLLDLFEHIDSLITISKCSPPLLPPSSFQPSSTFMHPPSPFHADAKTAYSPVFGLARPIYRLIGQISTLSSKRKYRVTPSYESRFRRAAANVERQLRAWEPALPSATLFSQTPFYAQNYDEAYHAACALRHAALLRLHQIVDGYAIPAETPSECLRKMLWHMGEIPEGARVEVQLFYPLVMAGSVALEEQDRDVIRRMWQRVDTRIRMGNSEAAQKLRESVWAGMDEEREGWGSGAGIRRMGINMKGLGEEGETVEINWAKMRWFDFKELVLF